MSAPINAEGCVTELALLIQERIAPDALDDVLTTIQCMVVKRDRLVKEYVFEEMVKRLDKACTENEEHGMQEAADRLSSLRKEMTR